MVKQVWQAGDEYFDTKEEALVAEEKATAEYEVRLTQLLNYNYGFKGPPGTVGFWYIEDEGPVDFGSSGSRLYLATFYGTYLAACQYALTLPRFWGYGPGKITKVEVVNDPTKPKG